MGKHSAQPARDSGRVGIAPRRRRLFSTLLIVAGLCLLAAAGFMWGQAQLRYWEQDKINRELAAYATVPDEIKDPSGAPVVDWEGLKAINPEVVGWLEVPGTAINYPVYQAEDNDKYLRQSATGEWSLGGQLFADYAGTRPGMVDALTLVYGHHLLDGSMFQSIADMDDQQKFDAVPTVWYVTEQATWELEPLLLYYARPDDQTVRTFNWESREAFHAYLAGRLGKAVTSRPDAAQAIAGAQHVLALVTCNYYDGYGRTVLLCVPKAEAAAVK